MFKKLQLSFSAILLSMGMIACGQSAGGLVGDSTISRNQESIFGEWVLVAVDHMDHKEAVNLSYEARLVVMGPTALSGGQGCSGALLVAPDADADAESLYLVDQSMPDQTCFLEFPNDDPRLPLVSDLNWGSHYTLYNGTMTLQGIYSNYLFERK